MPDSNLEPAYRVTDYRVEDGPFGPFVIRIGETSVELAELMFEECEFDWAYLTACNPGSVRLTGEENFHRTMELREILRARWPYHYFGVSVGRDGTWREPSFLVLGITEGDAVELARHFGQNAIVAGRLAEPARLVWVA
jgi:hypothetical protein